MKLKKLKLTALLSTVLALPIMVAAQQWPGGGPGPYGPYAAPMYGAGNPYAAELNALAIKDPSKHEACFKEANDKNLRHDARWKFMLQCMKK